MRVIFDIEEVRVKMPRSMHVSVRVNVDGVPLLFLLDTGATHSCIRKSIAKELGLPVVATTRVLASLLGTARVKVVRTHTIQLHKGIMHNFPLWVHPRLTEYDGVMGMDILIKYRIIIDFRKKELRLMKFGRPAKKKAP